MQLAVYLDALQADLASVAAAGSQEESELVQRIAAALAPALRLRLLEAISDAAAELSAQLHDGRVDVTLAGGEPSLVLVHDEPAEPAPAPEDAFSARITLRLPEQLKSRVEEAAGRNGLSVNAWLVHAIARSIERRPRPPRGYTGYARS